MMAMQILTTIEEKIQIKMVSTKLFYINNKFLSTLIILDIILLSRTPSLNQDKSRVKHILM